jgi:antitoxin (DNA-binding transcriptional repressor) of toxin-antitoxin stability system
METVSIRDLRGATLRERARRGEPLAITNHRVLIGVVIPAAPGWVEHLIYRNWRRVSQNIAEGEDALASEAPMITVQQLVAGEDPGEEPAPGWPEHGGRPDLPLTAAVVDGNVVHTAQSQETVERWRAAWNPALSADRLAAPSAVRAVRIGDLSARVIEEAGQAGETLAITHERELIGIVIPVTQDLVQYLIEKNLSRVLANIELGEKQLTTADEMTPLDREVTASG